MKSLLLAAVLLLCLAVEAGAQRPSRTWGRRFVIAFPDTVHGNRSQPESSMPGRSEAVIALFSDDTATVTITGLSFRRDVTVVPGVSTPVSLFDQNAPSPTVFPTNEGTVSRRTFTVSSDRELAVYCWFMSDHGAEGFTPLPVESWGKEYVPMHMEVPTLMRITYGDAGEPLEEVLRADFRPPIQIIVVAATDGTRVTIGGVLDGWPTERSFILDAGEAFLEERALQRAYVSASAPVGVVSGNTRNAGSDMYFSVNPMPTGGSMANSGVEWIWPAEMMGETFVYAPITKFTENAKEEVLRIYGASPGATDISSLDGRGWQVTQGDHLTFRGGASGNGTPFVYRTSRPSQAMVVTAPWMIQTAEPISGGNIVRTWSPAVATLVPRERWYSSAPFSSPVSPPYLEHYAWITADSAALVRLDGAPVKMTPIPRSPYSWALLQVEAGDHRITSEKGFFGAVAYGVGFGIEQYLPLRVNPEKGSDRPQHYSTYYEELARSYAYPLIGRVTPTVTPVEGCDMTEIEVANLDTVDEGELTVVIDPDSVNTVIVIEKVKGEGDHIGFRIRFTPLDRSAPGRAVVRISGRRGVRKIPYLHLPNELTAGPESIVLRDLRSGIDTLLSVTLGTLRKKGTVIREIRLLHGDAGKGGFSLAEDSPLGPLGFEEKRTVRVRLNAVGEAAGYADSLIIVSDCDTLIVPIAAFVSALRRNEECGLAEATIRGIDGALHAPLTITVDSPVNGEVTWRVIPTEGTTALGVTIRFTAIDPRARGSATVTIRGRDGRVWVVPMEYAGSTVEILPNPIDLGDLLPGATGGRSMTISGRGLYPIRVIAVRMAHGLLDGEGFSIGDLPPISVIEPRQSYPFTIRFYETGPGIHTDSLVLETECGTFTVPVRARVVDTSASIPFLSGYDWEKRRLTTANPCTRNDLDAYDAVVEIVNRGTAPFTVRSVELIGPDSDAGNFLLDNSDPLTRIGPGDLIQPVDRAEGRRYLQKVLFRPDAERYYSAIVRVIGESGDTITSILGGSGIESHLLMTDHDFGTIARTPGTIPTATALIPLRALPTRDLTLTGLRISGPDASTFRFASSFLDSLPTPTRPWVIPPGGTVTVPVEFVPVDGGPKRAYLEAMGDNSLCDDSVSLLTGRTEGAGITGAGTRAPVGCESSLFVTVRNEGGDDLLITDVLLDDPDRAFDLPPFPLPHRLAAGDSFLVDIVFVPPGSGAYTATLRLVLATGDGAVNLGSVETGITGEGYRHTGRAAIGREFRGAVGSVVRVPLLLDEAIMEPEARELRVKIDYDGRMAKLVTVYPGAILSDTWSIVDVDDAPGSRTLLLRSSDGSIPSGTGALLELAFALYLGGAVRSELAFTVEIPDLRCATIPTSPGSIAIDSICGLTMRLIEIASADYTLGEGRPNPFNPTTEIPYSVGLEGPTTLTIHDAAGVEVARLVDAVTAPGDYTVSWDAELFPSGVYFCTMRSGTWSAVRMLLLVK